MIIARLARGTSRTLSILLIALAALSLLIGGIVLMNILLISIGERVREIGLRRAVGASRRDILVQFLAESIAVTLLGSIFGGGLGLAGSLILAKAVRMPVAISGAPFLLAVAFAFLVGTFFGLQPARKASRLNPVEALR
jgi:ABC-type antimicrobial peptide transport system permease subunit